MKTKFYKILGYLQIFIGMSAISGGLPMILDPNGSDQGLSIEALQNSPFEDYFIPGLLLFAIIGIGSLIASYFSLKLKIEAGILGIIFGLGIIIWVVSQYLILGYVSWMQPLYLLIGVAELYLSFKIRKKLQ